MSSGPRWRVTLPGPAADQARPARRPAITARVPPGPIPPGA